MPATLEEYTSSLRSLLAACQASGKDGTSLSLADGMDTVERRFSALRKTPNKAITIGNGGSAAVSNHFVLDLWNNACIRAVSFSDASLLTCMGNDYGYEHIFKKPIGMFADAGDILLAISSSGRSPNILHAAEEARARGLWCVTMTGFSTDNPLRRMGDVNFFIDSASYGMVELSHAVLCHYICDLLSAK